MKYLITNPGGYRRAITVDVPELAHMTLCQLATETPGLPFRMSGSGTDIEAIVYLANIRYAVYHVAPDNLDRNLLFDTETFHSVKRFCHNQLYDVADNRSPMRLEVYYNDPHVPLLIFERQSYESEFVRDMMIRPFS